MAKDKRINISVDITTNGKVVVAPLRQQESGFFKGVIKPLLVLSLPMSAEEFMFRIDMANIKWKMMHFDDERVTRGVYEKHKTFRGDDFFLYKEDYRKSPDGFIKRLNRSFNRVVNIANMI